MKDEIISAGVRLKWFIGMMSGDGKLPDDACLVWVEPDEEDDSIMNVGIYSSEPFDAHATARIIADQFKISTRVIVETERIDAYRALQLPKPWNP